MAASDGHAIGPDGRCKTPVGNTVNVANAGFTNAIGDSYLQAFWQDPDYTSTIWYTPWISRSGHRTTTKTSTIWLPTQNRRGALAIDRLNHARELDSMPWMGACSTL